MTEGKPYALLGRAAFFGRSGRGEHCAGEIVLAYFQVQ
jgi:hypothetical protein